MVDVTLPIFCQACRKHVGSLAFYKKVDEVYLYACWDCVKSGVDENALIRMAYTQGFQEATRMIRESIGDVKNPIEPETPKEIQ